MHVSKKIDEIDIPNELMPSVCSTLEKLVADNHIPMDMVNRIVVTKKMPIEFAQYFGFDMLTQQITANSPSIPIGFNRNFYVGCSSSGFNSPNYGTASPNIGSWDTRLEARLVF